MASIEPSGQPMPIRTIVISMVVIGIGAIVFGLFVRPYDAEVSTFLIAMGILLPVSAVFFYMLYKKSVMNEFDVVHLYKYVHVPYSDLPSQTTHPVLR